MDMIVENNPWIDPEVIVAVNGLETIVTAKENPASHIVKYWELGEQFQARIKRQENFRADDLQKTRTVAASYMNIAAKMHELSVGLPTREKIYRFLEERYDLS